MRKILIVLVIGLVAGILLASGYVQQKGEYSFPESRREFEIQGLTWRTVSYYYHPGIYEEIYSPESNLRLVLKAKNVGANYLYIRAFYNGTEDGGVIGDYNEAATYLREAIATAHDFELGVFLVPYVESRDYWITKEWKLDEKNWTDVVLR
ncbi:hypothetical protein [Candidatus Hecatella orcuttiae]|uniref:hypothetical protein n=1 Tax=Candidatus Hecatella orcuttiae TaxID=1935119 RepID=UPI0028681574|nr:hypothetical protein [Candidatus Hecatella orcuttiae]